MPFRLVLQQMHDPLPMVRPVFEPCPVEPKAVEDLIYVVESELHIVCVCVVAGLFVLEEGDLRGNHFLEVFEAKRGV
jgi:hypothetical protein